MDRTPEAIIALIQQVSSSYQLNLSSSEAGDIIDYLISKAPKKFVENIEQLTGLTVRKAAKLLDYMVIEFTGGAVCIVNAEQPHQESSPELMFAELSKLAPAKLLEMYMYQFIHVGLFTNAEVTAFRQACSKINAEIVREREYKKYLELKEKFKDIQ